MLFDLLDARTPPQVLVRPFAQGNPVPLTEHTTTTPVVVAPPRPVAPPPVRTVAQPAAAPPIATPAEPVADGQEDVVAQMTAIWADTLGAGGYGTDDDFFSIGGNSLSAIG